MTLFENDVRCTLVGLHRALEILEQMPIPRQFKATCAEPSVACFGRAALRSVGLVSGAECGVKLRRAVVPLFRPGRRDTLRAGALRQNVIL